MDHLPPPLPAEAICFGLNRPTDEASLIGMVGRFARPRLLAALVPRLTDQEIDELAGLLGNLMRRRLDHREYHQLFLDNQETY